MKLFEMEYKVTFKIRATDEEFARGHADEELRIMDAAARDFMAQCVHEHVDEVEVGWMLTEVTVHDGDPASQNP